jgi:hypothetical protein
MRKQLVILMSMISVFTAQQDRAVAAAGKEFTTSVIYGTLAGTLVGAATLAFTANPGDNINNVARGASYGLYAGILLGAYVTYGMDDKEKEEEIDGEQGPTPNQEGQPADGQQDEQSLRKSKSDKAIITLYPVFDQRTSSGSVGQLTGLAVGIFNITF